MSPKKGPQKNCVNRSPPRTNLRAVNPFPRLPKPSFECIVRAGSACASGGVRLQGVKNVWKRNDRGPTEESRECKPYEHPVPYYYMRIIIRRYTTCVYTHCGVQ